jgi:hypothetical protein
MGQYSCFWNGFGMTDVESQGIDREYRGLRDLMGEWAKVQLASVVGRDTGRWVEQKREKVDDRSADDDEDTIATVEEGHCGGLVEGKKSAKNGRRLFKLTPGAWASGR